MLNEIADNCNVYLVTGYADMRKEIQQTIERYRKRTGHYPARVLADKIYRNRDNLAFCKEHHIQGMFFSPWDIGAGGHGRNVRAFYLNIKNPAPEGVVYKALNKFKVQNNAGIKARKYLESLGYDGVNNGDEEYIAFNSNQIKEISNISPTADHDIRYSLRDNYTSTQSLARDLKTELVSSLSADELDSNMK